MRFADGIWALAAAFLAFGGVVTRAQTGRWPTTLMFLGLAAVLALIAVRRTVTARKVVLVGRAWRGAVPALPDAIDEAGFALRFCGGPESRPCPVFDGRPCRVRGHPVGAVILERAGYAGPEPPCGPALHARTLTIQEGSDGDVMVTDGGARMGWAPGPVAAARTLREILERPRVRSAA